jgi:hypothetical protein
VKLRRYLTITSVPDGEAPVWVRQKWVGLRLPLTTPSQSPGVFRGEGVLTGPRTILSAIFSLLTHRTRKTEGYLVNVLEAVAVLERVHPDAAEWWKANAPHLVRPNRRFIFQKEAGHVDA